MADYGAQDTSTTTLGANQFPISEAWTPNSGFSAVEGGVQTTDAGGKKSAPVRMEVKDGSNLVEGATTDAAVTGDNSGTLSAKLRGLSKIFADIWDSVNHRIKVDGSGVTQPVSGTFWQATQPVSAASLPLPTGASTSAKQPALGTAGAASSDVLTVQGITSMTALKVDGSAVTQPVSGTFWQATQPVSGTVSITANSAVNVAQINGVTITTGNGVSGTGVQRVTLASDSTGQVTLATGANIIGALTANQSINSAQVGGTAIDTNSGVKSAGTQRVVLATDQPALTNALLTNPQAIASGGSTPSHTISAASTNATSLKASAGTLYGFSISNSNAAARFFKLYNKASAPTVGTDTPVMTVQLPASATVIRAFPVGLNFSTGIAWALTTGIADADTGAVGTDISVDLDWK